MRHRGQAGTLMPELIDQCKPVWVHRWHASRSHGLITATADENAARQRRPIHTGSLVLLGLKAALGGSRAARRQGAHPLQHAAHPWRPQEGAAPER
jgi:hypothetical protein